MPEPRGTPSSSAEQEQARAQRRPRSPRGPRAAAGAPRGAAPAGRDQHPGEQVEHQPDPAGGGGHDEGDPDRAAGPRRSRARAPRTRRRSRRRRGRGAAARDVSRVGGCRDVATPAHRRPLSGAARGRMASSIAPTVAARPGRPLSNRRSIVAGAVQRAPAAQARRSPARDERAEVDPSAGFSGTLQFRCRARLVAAEPRVAPSNSSTASTSSSADPDRPQTRGRRRAASRALPAAAGGASLHVDVEPAVSTSNSVAPRPPDLRPRGHADVAAGSGRLGPRRPSASAACRGRAEVDAAQVDLMRPTPISYLSPRLGGPGRAVVAVATAPSSEVDAGGRDHRRAAARAPAPAGSASARRP